MVTSRGASSSTARTTTSKSLAKPKARPQEVFLPAMEQEDIPWDPEAFPPDSDDGQDGYHGWGVDAMSLQDFS